MRAFLLLETLPVPSKGKQTGKIDECMMMQAASPKGCPAVMNQLKNYIKTLRLRRITERSGCGGFFANIRVVFQFCGINPFPADFRGKARK